MAEFDSAVGYVGTQHGLATNETPIDMTKKRQTALVALAPLSAVGRKVTSSRKARSYKSEIIQMSEMPHSLTVATSEASASTSLTFTDSDACQSIRKDSLLYNPAKNDHRLVTAAPSSATVSVSIDAAGSTSSAWDAGDDVFILNTALPEDDETIRRASPVDTHDYNYQQLAKLHFGLTREQNEIPTQFGGPGEKRKALQRAAYREYVIKDELGLYFGGRGSAGSGASMRYTAGGLNHFLRNGDLARDFGGMFTEGAMMRWLGDYADENPDVNRITFATSREICQAVSNFGNERLRFSPSDKSKTFGLQMDKIKVHGMTVDLMPLPLLNTKTSKGMGWLIHWESLWMNDLVKVQLIRDIKNAGESEIITDCYRSITSMMVANKSRFAMATSMTPESVI
jgi:hypothetical protein